MVCGDFEIYVQHFSNNFKENTIIARLRLNTAFIHKNRNDKSKYIILDFNRYQMDPHLVLEKSFYQGFAI